MINGIKRLNCVLLALLLLFPVFLVQGCGQQKEESGQVVYYLNSKATQLVPVSFAPTADDKEEQVGELLNQLQREPGSGDLQRVIPKAVKVNSHKVSDYRLDVDFSEEYYDMGAAQEVLVRAAVVRTLIQIDGIAFVNFTVNGEGLVNKQGQQVGSMGADSFVENPGKQINSSKETVLAMYFSNSKGDKLAKETRIIHYNPNISLEKLVMEQLVEGPKKAGNRAVLPGDTKLISVSAVDDVCYVNLDSTSVLAKTDVSENVLLYSIVDSLTELENVKKVQIAIDGKTKGKLRYVCDLSKVYKQDLSLLEEEK